jgi:hypothetical protein
MLGNRRNRLLRSCGNANSSFEESKPASHPFLGERIPRYVPPPTGVEPACVLVEVTDLFTTSLTFPPPREGQVVSQIKLPGERPSRTLILREDASCLVSTLWSRQPKYPNSSPPGIGRPGSCCPRDRAMMDVLEKLPGEQTKSGPPYGGGSVSAKYPNSSPPEINAAQMRTKTFPGELRGGRPFVGRSNRSSSPPGTRSRAPTRQLLWMAGLNPAMDKFCRGARTWRRHSEPLIWFALSSVSGSSPRSLRQAPRFEHARFRASPGIRVSPADFHRRYFEQAMLRKTKNPPERWLGRVRVKRTVDIA